MRRGTWRFVAAAGLLLPLLAGAPAAAKLFDVETFTLGNGLEVAVIPNHRAPTVTQMIWYKVGSADEPRGKGGIAHFLEHLMFRGTKETPSGAFARIVAQNGGRDNAYTTHDVTVFFQSVAADRLELMMKLESERMTDLVISDAVLLPERQVILEERHTRVDNVPSALLNEQVDAALFLHHPYHNPTIGWEMEMRGLDTATARAFYRDWYAPNNAVLVVSGDVTVERVRELANRYYGPIPARSIAGHHRVGEPPKVAATRLQMHSSRVSEPSWSRTYLAPSYTAGEKQYAYALQVLAEIIGGTASSRLYRSLVVDGAMALSAGCFYDPNALDLATFGFYARLKKDVPIADFEAALEAEVKKVVTEGVSAEEVERAKKRMQSVA